VLCDKASKFEVQGVSASVERVKSEINLNLKEAAKELSDLKERFLKSQEDTGP
jgi:hypothetical protein